jgi:hypothetical protein
LWKQDFGADAFSKLIRNTTVTFSERQVKSLSG